MTNETFTLRNPQSLTLAPNNIFHWNFAENCQITLSDAREAYEYVNQMLKGKKVPVLVDMRKNLQMDRKARAFYAQRAGKYFKAGAIIVKSPISKIIANFFLGFNKPPMPMRIVNSEEEGIAWLLSVS